MESGVVNWNVDGMHPGRCAAWMQYRSKCGLDKLQQFRCLLQNCISNEFNKRELVWRQLEVQQLDR